MHNTLFKIPPATSTHSSKFSPTFLMNSQLEQMRQIGLVTGSLRSSIVKRLSDELQVCGVLHPPTTRSFFPCGFKSRSKKSQQIRTERNLLRIVLSEKEYVKNVKIPTRNRPKSITSSTHHHISCAIFFLLLGTVKIFSSFIV